MKLDFTLLSRPAFAPPGPRTWGQAGTAGTPASMRVPASSVCGDGSGTGGDKHTSPTMHGIAGAAADHQHGEPCPPASPPRPQPAPTGMPNEINVSPVSPLVPSAAVMNEHGDEFEHEAFEERAAIMEFDGRLTRADAEAAARALLRTTTAIYARN